MGANGVAKYGTAVFARRLSVGLKLLSLVNQAPRWLTPLLSAKPGDESPGDSYSDTRFKHLRRLLPFWCLRGVVRGLQPPQLFPAQIGRKLIVIKEQYWTIADKDVVRIL